MAFLNKLIVVSQRANNLKHQQEQEGHSMERIIEVPVVYKTGNNHHPDFEDDINAHQDLVHFPYPLERHDEGVSITSDYSYNKLLPSALLYSL